ncbi:SulP family inorganic anion transporter [Chloroflexota bacterium]
MKKTILRQRTTLPQDFLAGATGAVAGAPQSMAFAMIAGLSPIYGLYAAIVATISGTLAVSSTFMTVAPTNALALVVGSTLMGYTGQDQLARLFTLTLLVGVFLFLFGVFRLGGLTRFVSNAVMTGFITGAGTLIILGQLRNLTGYQSTVSGPYVVRFWDWLTHLPQSDLQTTVTGITALVIIYVLRQTRLKYWASLFGIGAASLLVSLLGWHNVLMVRDISSIPAGLPALMLPDLRYVPELALSALAMAVLVAVQSAGLSQTIPEPDGSIPDATRDFTGQGIANIVGSFFQGMPSGGSLSRTAVNVSAGARSRLSNVFAGAFIGLTVMFLGPLIERVTLTGLAALLIVAALSLINVENLSIVWNVNKSARFLLVVTYLATLTLPLEFSIYIGIVLSLGLYLYTSAARIQVVQLIPFNGVQFREATVPVELPADIPLILSVSGNLYFGAIQRLEELLPNPNDVKHPIVILRMRDHQYLGSTGIRFIERYSTQLAARQGRLMLTGIGPRVYQQLERTKAVEFLGSENIFCAEDVLFESTTHALTDARRWLTQEWTVGAAD